MEQSNNTGQILGALLVGAAIGGVLGVLFAPEKGSETRKSISSKGEELSGSIKDKFNDLISEIRKDATQVKERASEYMENGSPITDKQKTI